MKYLLAALMLLTSEAVAQGPQTGPAELPGYMPHPPSRLPALGHPAQVPPTQAHPAQAHPAQAHPAQAHPIQAPPRPAPVGYADVAPGSPEMIELLQRRLAALEAEVVGGGRGAAVQQASHLAPACCDSCGYPQAACCCGPSGPSLPTVQVTGFFHLDAGWYSQDAGNRATLGDIEDALGFRRARLAATGDVAENTSYILEIDFAQSQPRFVDVWMDFAKTRWGDLRIGRYRQPFGMTELTSAKDLAFLERPLPFALSPFRQTGVMLSDTAIDENVTWAVSGYRHLSDNFGNVYGDQGGYGMATRITMLLLDDGQNDLLHVGLGYSHNDPGRDLEQYVSTNEFFGGQNPLLGPGGLSVLPLVAVPPFVNTGFMPMSRSNLYNLEAAVSMGAWVFQSEARWAVVELLDGTVNTFPGAYAQVRYMLTGESIPYNDRAGAFGSPRPRSRRGAWELAARLSHLDLDGDNLPGPGGRLTDTTLGVNWYLNPHTKFQFNWIHASLHDRVLGGSSASTVAARGQLDF